jgi:DNA invertase Pin-like site-specific DNA recombinase
MKTNLTETKTAAILTRSATEQNNLQIQLAECQKLAVEHGYTVAHEYRITESGNNLNENPEFKNLLGLIKNQAIDAVIIYDRDRLHSDPLSRLMFIDDCLKSGVQIITVHGEPITDLLVEHVYAQSKKQQVLHLRAATKAGIADAKRRKEQSK